ncbi:hypothetical protein Tco_0891626 [Tanacetum coccineum]|uniref:Uncharacterized protein n=1 Tax=Tanacetum coccineum TaxID=301880 RepID=A0ABQ5C8W6_9ASTR
MWKITTAFLRGEVAAGNQERKKTIPPWKQQDAGHRQNSKKGGFKNQQRKAVAFDQRLKQKQWEDPNKGWQKKGDSRQDKDKQTSNPDGNVGTEDMPIKGITQNSLRRTIDLVPTLRGRRLKRKGGPGY